MENVTTHTQQVCGHIGLQLACVEFWMQQPALLNCLFSMLLLVGHTSYEGRKKPIGSHVGRDLDMLPDAEGHVIMPGGVDMCSWRCCHLGVHT